jgi:hypothetical protein
MSGAHVFPRPSEEMRAILAKPTRRGPFAMRANCPLFVEDHTQERAVNLQPAVVVDKA